MNALKSRILTAAIALTASTLSFAQDAHFSQYYANPIYLNPAFAGLDRCPTVHTNYRNQYPELGVYQTYSASYDQYVDKLNGGVALMALRDDAGNGALNLTEVSGVYSYHLEVNRHFTLLSGFQATFRQRTLDWGQFTFPDMIDPFYGFVLPTNEVAPGNNYQQPLGPKLWYARLYRALVHRCSGSPLDRTKRSIPEPEPFAIETYCACWC